MRRTLAVVSLTGVVAFPGAVLAQFDACVVFTRVHRVFQVSAGAAANLDGLPICLDNHSDEAASDSWAIDSEIDISARCSDSRGFCDGYALASHLGVEEPLHLSSTIIGHGSGRAAFSPAQHASGTGIAILETEFDVLQARPFSLSGSLSANVVGYVQPSAAEASFSLIGPGLSIEREVRVTHDDRSPSAALKESGSLAPGHYVLIMRTRGYGYNIPEAPAIGNASASFTLALEPRPGSGNPRCPQDWNNDGVVDSRDFFAFLTDFFVGTADFNGDCITDSRDFFEFIQHFFVICD